MDKSGRYMGMCRVAVDIQSRWIPEPGDFFCLPDDPVAGVQCHVPTASSPTRIQNGLLIKETPEDTVQLIRVVWLPRLNQLMEMARHLPYSFRDITFQFYDWVKVPYGHQRVIPEKYFHSLEQVWFAFVMAQVYGKIWNGEQWETVT